MLLGPEPMAAEPSSAGCSQLGDRILQVKLVWEMGVSETRCPIVVKEGGGMSRGEDQEALQSLERERQRANEL